jgi:hypothetical protein
MTRFYGSLCATVLAATMAATSIVPSQAAPLRAPAVAAPENAGMVVQVDHRRHHRWGHGRRYRGGGGDAAAIVGGLAAGAIIGGLLANPGPRYRERYYEDDYVEVPVRRVYRERRVRMDDAHIDWCLSRYASYDIRSDTWQPYNGPRRYCNSPYN